MRKAISTITAIILMAIGLWAQGNCDGANNCYVSKIATGNGSGSDWTNACTDFTGSCDVSNVAMRGTTIWVAGSPGVQTGGPAYTTQNFTAPDSGTTPITIIVPTPQNHGTEIGWRRQFATAIATLTGPITITTDYWIFNGQTRSSNNPNSSWPKTPIGLSQNGGTAHDQPYGYHIQVYNGSSSACSVNVSGNFVTLEYIYIQGKGVASPTTGGAYGQNITDNGLCYTGSTVHDEYLGYSWVGYTGLDSVTISSGTNYTFEYDLFTKNHMGAAATKSQAISIGDVSNLIIRYSHFQDITNTAILTDTNADATAFTPNWYFYGNDIFWDTVVKTGTNYGLSAGIINLTGETLNGGVIHVYNNTIAGLNTAACTSIQSCNAYALNMNGAVGGTCAAHTQNCFSGSAPVGTVYNNLWWNPFVAANVNTTGSPQWTPTADYGEGICATTGCTNSGSFTIVGAHDTSHNTGNPFKSFNAIMGTVNWYNFNFLPTADTDAGLTIPNGSTTPPGCSLNCESNDPIMANRGDDGVYERGQLQIQTRKLLTVGTVNRGAGVHIGSTFQETPQCTWSSAPTTDSCPDGVAPFIKNWYSREATTATVNSTGLVTGVANHNTFIGLDYGGVSNYNGTVIVVTDGLGTKPVATLPVGIVRTGSDLPFSGYDTTTFDSNFPTTFSDPCPIDNPPTCRRYTPTTSSQLVTDLALTNPGDTIQLAAGTIYGTNGTFFLPARSNPSHKWTYIVSSNMTSISGQGTRVKPSDAVNMPKIVATAGGTPISANQGADHWWIAGIELYNGATCGQNGIVCNANAPYPQINSFITTQAVDTPVNSTNVPDSITIDRCYLHGDAQHDVQHGIVMNATHYAILDSYLTFVKEFQTQANGLASYFTSGPIKVLNSYFEGGAQDSIMGGAGGISNMWSLQDAYFARNTFQNDPTWRVVGVTIPPKAQWTIGNNFEFKICTRCLVDGNLMEQSWLAAQGGGQILMNAGTGPNGPDEAIDDITFSNNIITGGIQPIASGQFAADLDCDASQAFCLYPGENRRVNYFNNLILQGPQGPPGGRSALGANALMATVPRLNADVLFQHNTFVGPYLTDHIYCDATIYFNPVTNSVGTLTDLPPSENVWILDNVLCRQITGVAGGSHLGTPALNIWMQDPSTGTIPTRFFGNVMQLYSGPPLNEVQSTYPPNNQALFYNTNPFQYNNTITGDYTLASPTQLGSDGVQTGIQNSTLQAHQAPPLGSCSIAGTVSGVISSGVALSMTGDSTTAIYSNADGTYKFTGLGSGTYKITPFGIPPVNTTASYAFTPVNATITLTSPTCTSTGNNFTSALAVTYSISGTVTLNGAGLSGVSIALTGSGTGTTTTDSSGNYTFPGLAPGSYVLTPTLSGYSFIPVNLSETIVSANITGANFTATATSFSISGTVSGAVVSGVTMTLSGAGSRTTTTNSSGNYTFNNLSNGNYTVTPSKSGYSFTPINRAVTVNGANVTGVNFTSAQNTYSISGTISGAIAGGVTVTLTGAANQTTTSAANGTYSFTSLVNGTYTVTPTAIGYSFTPVNQVVIINGANEPGIDFTSSVLPPPTHLISGTVTGDVQAGVLMTLTGTSMATTNTAGNGTYSFTNLANGPYTITPSKKGFIFKPINISVTISGTDITGQNFQSIKQPIWHFPAVCEPKVCP